MNKIAIITDTHVGARSSSSIFRNYMKWWYENMFFPHLDEHEIKTIIHAGDFFDNRNSINLLDIDFVCNFFAEQLISRSITMYCIVGNHDTAFKNTNEINSLQLLQKAAPCNVYVVDDLMEISEGDQKYLLVPWINNSNLQESLDKIENCDDKENTICIGHFEIQGCLMYSNSPPCEHGLKQSTFKGFKDVWSGHFHHPNRIGNIQYLGSPFHLNWQDHGDPRGYYFYDESGLEFVENEYCLFYEYEFDEQDFELLTETELNEMFGSRFVRLVINKEPSKKTVLLKAISKINNQKPHDLQVINNVVIKPKEVVQSKTTTKTTLDYIENSVSNTGVLDLMKEILVEAEALQQKGE